MKFKKIIFACFIFSSLTSTAKEVLFEGYQKILSGGVHIGYNINKYEFDPKKKQFSALSFTKTGALGGNGNELTESIVAHADIDLNPISYSYTSILGKQVKTIDAKFSKNKMTAEVKEGSKKSKISLDIPKGAFLSQFLIYLMLKSKTGLQADSNYKYKAIAEEDAKLYEGQALVQKQEKYNGLMAFKIINNFKDSKFVAFVTERGEALGVVSPAQNISTELVAKPSEATAQFGVSASILKNVFGEVPLGTNNIVSKTLKNEVLEPERSKTIGVPQGEGIMIKMQPTPSENKPKEEKKDK